MTPIPSNRHTNASEQPILLVRLHSTKLVEPPREITSNTSEALEER